MILDTVWWRSVSTVCVRLLFFVSILHRNAHKKPDHARSRSNATHFGLVCVCERTPQTPPISNATCIFFRSVFFTFDYAKGTQKRTHTDFSLSDLALCFFCFATFSYHNSAILLWIDYLIYIFHSLDRWMDYFPLSPHYIDRKRSYFFRLICLVFVQYLSANLRLWCCWLQYQQQLFTARPNWMLLKWMRAQDVKQN